MSQSFAVLQASYGRCIRKRTFIPRFYELLLASDEVIREMFSATDWSRQNRMLRRSISIALSWVGGSRGAERSLIEMADVHSRSGRVPVPPELYANWRSCLLQSVREHDDRLTAGMELKWAEALKLTTDFFASRY